MSRSYKKTPIAGCGGKRTSDKWYKSKEHRAERRQIKQDLESGKELLPHPKCYGNRWASPKDGRSYFGDLNPQWYYLYTDIKKAMRK